MAVVSGGPRGAVYAALRAIDVLDPCDVVITIDDVTRGKPAPDLHLAALFAVARPAAECLAYEDSAGGLAAAAAASVRAFDIRDLATPYMAVRRETVDGL